MRPTVKVKCSVVPLIIITPWVLMAAYFLFSRAIYVPVELDHLDATDSRTRSELTKIAVNKFAEKYFTPKSDYLEKPEEDFEYKTLLITYLASEIIVKVTKMGYIFTFSTMLYSSWKYVLENYDWAKDPKTAMKLDILVYYSDTLDSEKLPADCLELSDASQLVKSKKSSCFKRRITEQKFEYKILNQYSFLRDPEFEEMISHYSHIARTDPDTFLTPSFFSWKLDPTVDIVIGRGDYYHDFNYEMLQKIADQLGWKRQSYKMVNIGPTTVGKTENFVELMRKTAFAVNYVYENGFNVRKYPAIKPWMEMNKSLGHWPEWWRLVCALYGADLAVQDMFPNLVERINHPQYTLDVVSWDWNLIIADVKHLHAYYNVNKFSKMEFYLSVPKYCQNFTEFLSSTKRLSQLGRFDPATRCVDYMDSVAKSGALEYIIQKSCKNLY